MQTATADSLVGRTLEGRYRILDRIARGGMSTVYAAVDERLDRLVAVKVMNRALSADPAFSDRFAREARAAARLTHLNVVSVYDQGHEVAADGHHVFLVMELVEGRTLRELMHERGRLTPAEAVSIMEPVLSALSAAHRAGLVHRDVKPENILLSDEGVVKVADFGLARAIETDASSTRTGLMMGTVAYCSPEQISRGNADPRSDVYSAGVVFFELLTGTPAVPRRVGHEHRLPARAQPRPGAVVAGQGHPVRDRRDRRRRHRQRPDRPPDRRRGAARRAGRRAGPALAAGHPRAAAAARAPAGRRPAATHRARSATARTTTVRNGAGTATDATTDSLRGKPARHDTTVVPQRGANGARPAAPRHDDAGPPPPVVIPPSKRANGARPKHPRRRALIVTLLILLLGVGAFFGAKAFIAWRFSHVPDVSRLSQETALSKLRNAGYDAKVQPGPEFSETIPKGDVIRSDPSGGQRVPTGHTVTITISAGPRYYALPSVRGQTPDAAKSTLLAVGPLTVSPTLKQAYSDTVPEGQVIGTTPAAGAQVRGGQTITITVSKGLPTVQIPDISAGTPYDQAKQQLTALKFKVSRDDEFNDSVPQGAVVSVSPTGPATKFSTVTVVVSKGPDVVQVPDIPLGTPIAAAQATLQQAGLVPQIVPIGGSTPVSVLTTRPGKGQTVKRGSQVVVYAAAT